MPKHKRREYIIPTGEILWQSFISVVCSTWRVGLAVVASRLFVQFSFGCSSLPLSETSKVTYLLELAVVDVCLKLKDVGCSMYGFHFQDFMILGNLPA